MAKTAGSPHHRFRRPRAQTDEQIMEYMSAGYRSRREAMLYFPLVPHHRWHVDSCERLSTARLPRAGLARMGGKLDEEISTLRFSIRRASCTSVRSAIRATP